MESTYRVSRPGDESGLKYLWKTVFGDSDEYIDAFLKNMYTPGCARVCEINGKIVSAAYLLELGHLICPEASATPATVLYAFATLPEYRGKGIGGKVCDMILQHSEGSARTVCPAEGSLFGYYKTRYGYEPFFPVFEKKLTACEHPADITPVSAPQYGEIREKLLRGRAHIRYNEKTLSYQQLLCKNSGGNIISFPCGCAAYEFESGTLKFKELLCEGNPEVAASAIAAAAGAKSAVLRTPCGGMGTDPRPFAMIMPDALPEKSAPQPWYGFAFD